MRFEPVRRAIVSTPGLHEFLTRLLDASNARYFRRQDAHHHFRDQIRGLRNRRHGERCFIIGNGPSLNPHDLEAIDGAFSIGSNRIYSMFGRTRWRPSLYLAQDVYDEKLAAFVKEHSVVTGDTGMSILTGAYFRRRWRLTHPHVPAFLGLKSAQHRGFSLDCAESVTEYATVTFTALQFAAYLGYREIVLLGVDHAYSRTVTSRGDVETHEEVKDHFYDSADAPTPLADIQGMEDAYLMARDACARSGISVYDATRGGRLRIFPKRPLEQFT